MSTGVARATETAPLVDPPHTDAVIPDDHPGAVEAKLDPRIEVHRQQKEALTHTTDVERVRRRIELGLSPYLDREDCAIYVRRQLSETERAAFRTRGIEINPDVWVPPVPARRHPNGFHAARVPYSALAALADDPNVAEVRSVEFPVVRFNDIARGDLGLNVLHSGTGVTKRTGLGVKICVIDSGLDVSHGDFKTPAETFDVTTGTGASNWSTNVASAKSDHGTHVAGSAVGTGALSAGQYKGMGPDASLHFYDVEDSTGAISSYGMLLAVKRSEVVGCRVMSMSLGSLGAELDGSGSLEQAIDAATLKGMTSFIAAGNDGATKWHAQSADIPSFGTKTVSFSIDNLGSTAAYTAEVNINVAWIQPGSFSKKITSSMTVGTGETFSIVSTWPSNRQTWIQNVKLKPNVAGSTKKTYTLTLTNSWDVTSISPHVYILSRPPNIAFTSPSSATTLASPAVADSAVTVGAMVSRTQWLNYQGKTVLGFSEVVGTVASFSSRGPRIDGILKPDLIAPGAFVISARNKLVPPDLAFVIDNDGLTQNGSGPANYLAAPGTSMATPITAGAATLLIEAYPGLSGAEVKARLKATATLAATPNTNAGSGRADISKALLCGNGIVDLGEQCDLASTSTSDCCTTNCQFELAGVGCDDGNKCTNTSKCTGTSITCTGSNPTTCTALDQCHVAGTCDPGTGACSNPNKADGTSCDDGDASTGLDRCLKGACVGSDLCANVLCTATDQCHSPGFCASGTGLCSPETQKPNGTPCDDGRPQSSGETCLNGTCTAPDYCVIFNIQCDPPINQCYYGNFCNPDTGSCSAPQFRPAGTSCNDGNALTKNDACFSGYCGGEPLCTGVTCTVQDQCHVLGTCNPLTGVCSNPNKPNSTACDDANTLTKNDACTAGTCVGAPFNQVFESVGWQQLGNSGSPTQREGHAMATFGANVPTVGGKVVLFGGYDPSLFSTLDDTWTWTNGVWAKLSPPVRPAPRSGHAMAPLGNKLVLFGGSNGGIGNETWEFDGATWTQRFPENSPSERRYAAMASRGDKVVLFGGLDGGSTYMRDTWEWDGTNWVDRTLEGGPSRRAFHAMATRSDRVVLFGGYDASLSARTNDTWEWDGQTWVDRSSPSRPPVRHSHTMSRMVLSLGDRVLLFGGSSAAGEAMNDAWGWNGTAWTPFTDASRPSVRHTSAMSHQGTGVLLFGGKANVNNVALEDTWIARSRYSIASECTTHQDCHGGNCIDGVCCNSVCGSGNTQDCIACSKAAGAPSDGGCSPLFGGTCNDSNSNTVNDTCSSGTCAGIDLCAGVTCTTTSPCHLTSVCNQQTGLCSPSTPKPNGTTCDDLSPCTQDDTCTAGVCSGASTLSCSGGNGCTTGSCQVSALRWSDAANTLTTRYFHAAARLADGRVLVVGGQGGLPFSEVYDPSKNTWKATGNMVIGSGPVATLLQNGQVLASSRGGDGSVSWVAVYDPGLNDWLTRAPLVTARGNHTQTLLLDGTVLVAGGNTNTGPVQSAERYNPNTDTWTSASSMSKARGNHAAARLLDGRVLVVGGQYGVDLYNPASNSWSTMNDMNVSRTYTAATVLNDGRVLVAGGIGNAGVLSSAETFNPATGAWSMTGPMGVARFGVGMAALPSGKVLIAGGEAAGNIKQAATETFEPSTNVWSTAGSLRVARSQFTLTWLSGGRALAAGGFVDQPAGPTSSTETYSETYCPSAPIGTSCNDGDAATTRDVCTNTYCAGTTPSQTLESYRWEQKQPPTKPPARQFGLMATRSDKAVLFGGTTPAGAVNDTWEWDGSTWSERAIGAGPPARGQTAMAGLGDKVVLFGGRSGGGSVTGDTWIWDGSSWSQRTPLQSPTARYDHAMARSGAKLALYGGLDTSTFNVTGDVWEWDGLRWSTRTGLGTGPGPRTESRMATLLGSAVVTGGYQASGPFGTGTHTLGSSGDWTSVSSDTGQRHGHAMAAAESRLVIFGGVASGSLSDQTWEWNGSTWTQRVLTTKPSARTRHAMATQGRNVVLFGGTPNFTVYLDDTWVYRPVFAQGSDCTESGDCGSGYCVDGVCCNSVCGSGTTSDCQACSTAAGAATNGVCGASNGNGCDDGDATTSQDVCTSGYCGGTNLCTGVVCPLPADSCHEAGVCNLATGTCSPITVKADGSRCTDGDLCTQNDTCEAGVCGAGSPVTCQASDSCHAAGACSAAVQPFTAAAPLRKRRESHSATRLANGKVLVVGGYVSGVGQIPDCEIYDPASNSWTSAASLPLGLYRHTATLLANGKVLVVGGSSAGQSVTSGALVYDPATNQWTTAGSMSVRRDRHTATLLQNGKVLVTGGSDELNSLYVNSELYDPATNTWTTAAAAPVARYLHSATRLATGKVLVVGGSDNTTTLKRVDVYDPGTNTWTPLAPMPMGRSSHATIGLSDGRVLVAGGTNHLGYVLSASTYQPTTNTWAPAGQLPAGRTRPMASDIGDGRIMLIGSGTGAPERAEIYDIGSNTWTSGGSRSTAWYDFTATALQDGRVLLTGGRLVNTTLDLTELYSVTDCAGPALANGTSCQDGDGCTLTDTCQSGSCVGSSVVTCGATDDCHLPGTCQPLLGCSNPLRPNGTACDDADVCTQSDACVAGTCSGSDPITCAAAGPCREAGTCDPALGCTSPHRPDATLCNDGDPCTLTDMCSAGECLGASPVVCTASDQCHAPGSCSGASNPWQAGTALGAARRNHTATLLLDGRLLITGGASDASPELASAAIYDPRTSTWTNESPMSIGRLLHTASLLPNGKVLVYGGIGGSQFLNTAEIYDPVTRTWSAAASTTGNNFGHTASVLEDGRVLMVGLLQEPQLYDPSSNAWAATGTAPRSWNNHTATTLRDGRVLVVGGASTGAAGSASAHLYDPSSNTWSAAASMSTPRKVHAAALLESGKVLVTGGESDGVAFATAEIYDPASNSWAATPPFAGPRSYHTATSRPGGGVVLVGGAAAPSAVAGVVTYSESTGTWSTSGTLTNGRYLHSTTLLDTGALLVVGGVNAATLTSVEVDTKTTCSAGPVKPDGATCSDGNACTTGDLCQAGACAAGTTTSCPATDACHMAGVCNPQTGCTNPAVQEGTVCDDGSLCTLNETCRSGSCTPAAAILCAQPDGCHFLGACEAATGLCSSPTKETGAVCDDGNPCTQTDTCQAGSCTGSSPVVCAASDQCHMAGSCSAAGGQWSATAPLPIAKSSFAATSLQDGTVLVAGGFAITGASATSDLYDPKAKSWSPSGALTMPRSDGKAARLLDGRVLLVGGSSVAAARSAELYLPASKTWMQASPPLIERRDHTVTLVPDGQVLVVGGSSVAARTSAELYDPLTGTWTAAGSLGAARMFHSATLLASGRVLIVGGSLSGQTTALYEPWSRKWTVSGSMKVARTQATATLLGSGKVLVTGGVFGSNSKTGVAYNVAEVEVYDPATGKWSSVAPMATVRSVASATLLPTGDVLIAGGSAQDGTVASTERWNEASNTWVSAGDLMTKRSQHAAVLLDDGGLLAIGGYGASMIAAVEEYRAVTACSNPAKPNGETCTDGSACTRVDTCVSGVCLGVDPVNCPAMDSCHVPGTCDVATGACSVVAKDDGAACDDGNACTQIDLCGAGVCQGSSPVTCAPSDQCHAAGTCDPVAGCTDPVREDDSACDDESTLTKNDVCKDGECVGVPLCTGVVCTASDACHVAGQCNPATGTCSSPNAPDGTTCNDGDGLTKTDVCTAGTCAGVSLCAGVVCSAADACHVAGTCTLATGLCTTPAAPDGTLCDDLDPLTASDGCVNGSCVGLGLCTGVTCTALDGCHLAGTCDTATGACSNPLASDATPCDDGDASTKNDACASGSCDGVALCTGVICQAKDACHLAGLCDVATGACSDPPIPDGLACDDASASTKNDVCTAGLCGGVPLCDGVTCGASDACHVAGTCDVQTGLCSHPNAPNGVPCDDDDALTDDDRCDDGQCIGLGLCTGVVCAAQGPCKVAGTCDTSTGLCDSSDAPDGAACDDGDAGTKTDACTSGSCAGVPLCTGVVCTAKDACHVAGTCEPATGLCSDPPAPDGASCDDQKPLTKSDACTGGVCAGVPLCTGVVCTAVSDCRLPGTCSPTTGLCNNPKAPNGKICDDSDALTKSDRCLDGACAGVPLCSGVVCAPSDACHVAGACSPATGSCTHPAAPDLTACDDGDALTRDDGCSNGVCAGVPLCDGVVCSAKSNCHDVGTCNVATGVCSDPMLPDATACDDGDALTKADACTSGVCAGVPLCTGVDCVAKDGCHLVGECDSTTGECSEPLAEDESPCDDGDFDTLYDTCIGGTCAGISICTGVVCQPIDGCHLAGVCSTGTGECTNPLAPNARPCDDGDATTRSDACVNGTCTGLPLCTGVVCTAQDACHIAGTCVPETGLCTNPPAPNTQPCNDGDAATKADLCTDGVCAGKPLCDGVVCAPLSACHVAGVCNSSTGSCSNPSGPDGIGCDDGDPNTSADRCQAGKCVGVGLCTGVVCTASDTCHVAGTCDTATGLCSNPNAPNAQACSDGNLATKDDRCVSGVCVGVSLCSGVVCAAGGPCRTAGQCNPMTGVCSKSLARHGGSCSDGNALTKNDTCVKGNCVGVSLCSGVTCAPLDACHIPGSCDASTGACSTPLAPEGSLCDDGDGFTSGDRCQGGLCVGIGLCTGVTCEGAGPCHAPGVCISATGSCSAPTPLTGIACDDDDSATKNDVCTSGACNGVPLCDGVVCIASDACHLAGVCDPLTGACTNPTTADGAECDDGDVLTKSDVCAGGDCAGVSLCTGVVCTPLDACHTVGVCDELTGACDDPPVPDGTSCNDDDLYTNDDQCQDGLCVGVGRCTGVTCAALGPCYAVGVCSSETGVCSHPYAAALTACDDGDAHTKSDTCTEGVCAGQPLCAGVVCAPKDACHVSGVCDVATGLCDEPNAADGTACDDADTSTRDDACGSGVCAGVPRCFGVVCTAKNACHVAGTCNGETGLCDDPPAKNNTPCDDGDAATKVDLCTGGACVGVPLCTGVVCTAQDGCHAVGTCDPGTGTCSTAPLPDATACDDGDALTRDDVCTLGVCAGRPLCDGVSCTASDACHLAGICDPTSGECTSPVALDGAPCDDGDTFTSEDRCQGGTCVGVGLCTGVVCTAKDACHLAGSCDSATGLCSQPNAPNTQTCDDGDSLTMTDRCVSGTCVGLPLCAGVVCTASGPCRVAGTCNPATGVCSNRAAPTGTTCDDGNTSTKNDRCTKGTCAGVPLCTGVVCTPKDGCHLVGTCDAATGLCSNPLAPNGASCDDGDGSTSGDACQAGACLGTGPCTGVTCAGNDACHAPGTCSTATGLCSAPVALTGTACDDGNASTKNDLCVSGTCAGVPLCTGVVCAAADACHLAGACDPASGACTSPLAGDGKGCDDGDALTKADVCVGGACAGVPLCAGVVCAPEDDCHDVGVCDGATGECEPVPVTDGSFCDDADPLTNDDQCQSGVCIGFGRCTGVVCMALDDCHVAGKCDSATGACSHPIAADGVFCNDGDAATKDDVCNGGACEGVPLCQGVVCVAKDGCHVAGTCVPATGACTEPAATDGAGCDDDDTLTRDDACEAGVCVGVPRCFGVVCTAKDACHVAGTCNPDTGMCDAPNARNITPCDDGDTATKADLCTNGMCKGVPLCAGVVCLASDQCHAPGVCDPGTGVCSKPAAPDGTVCDDDDSLTIGDQCVNGACAGAPRCEGVVCNASGPCRFAGSCDPVTGTCSSPTAPDDTGCDDGDTFTTGDRCQSGVCVGDGLCTGVVCTASDACHLAGKCDSATGLCSNPPAPNATACDDGDPLTTGDRCTSGTCLGFPLCAGVVCTAAGPCRVSGSCDPATGACSNPPAPDGGGCDDADVLSKDDACVSGVCTGVPLCEGVICAAQDSCHTAGACLAATGICTKPNAPDGTPCDDSDGFTSDDQCAAGVCVGIGLCTGVTCAAATCHAPGECDTATGACGAPIPLSGTSCDDGDASTKGDVCSNGTCVGVPLCSGVVCAAVGQCRIAGACDPATGLCSNPAAPNATACDDGDALTKQDRCTQGACAGVPLCTGVVCDATDDCHDEGVCDATTGACTEPALADLTPCDDGDALTNDDRCEAGACVGFGRCTGVVCTALGPCHVAGTCDTATGACDHPHASSGTLCDDGDAMTQDDVCSDGVCTGLPLCAGVVCVAADACHVPGSCDPATGTCSNPLVADGTACDDADGRTRDDVCETGTCIGVPRCFGVVCTAKDACHVAGTCNGDTGVCDEPTAADGTPCDDADGLTKADVCSGGVCSGVSLCTGVECVAAEPCHVVGVCDAKTGTCDSPTVADGVSCDDGDSLTKADACSSGVCAGVPLCTGVSCVAADVCHVAGECDAATGTCSSPLAAAGVLCDDGDACTESGACVDGACVAGKPLECFAENDCHDVGKCDPATGQCSTPTKDDGAGCDDGEACTGDDQCAEGQCQGTAFGCDDENPCTADSCASDECVHTAQSGACSDGDACTDNDACDGGVCVGAAVLCDDGDPCTTDLCTAAGCTHAPASGPCDDGDGCTVDDTCGAGGCAGTAKACAAGFACKAGECADTQCRTCDGAADCAPGAGCVTLSGEGRCLRDCSESETCLDTETCATDADGLRHCYQTDDGPCSEPTVPSDDVGTTVEPGGDVQVGGDVAVNDVISGGDTSDVATGGSDEGGCQAGASRSSSPAVMLLILLTLVLGAGMRRRRRAPR